MKRADFIKIIRLRSMWRIDKRRGDYKLPNGDRLSSYVRGLVREQMKLDKLLIMKNGDLCFGCGGAYNEEKKQFEDYCLMPCFGKDETCTVYDMDKRIYRLTQDITGY